MTATTIPTETPEEKEVLDQLQKETKRSYKSEEFWKDAPEGATHWDNVALVFCNQKGYWPLNNVFDYVKDDEQNLWCDPSRYEPRPKPSPVDAKPIYTQEMADKGELPQVGMRVVARCNHDSKTVTHCGYVLYLSKYRLILDINGNEWHGLIGDYIIEPIDTRTDKEKAIADLVSILEKASELVEDYEIDATAIYDAGYRKIKE